MKITLSRETLLDLLSASVAAIPVRSTLPIQTNVLIRATESGIEFVGGDGDVTVVARGGGETLRAGEITVPGKHFQSLARTLPAGTVTLEVTGSKLLIKAGKGKFTLAALPADDYPALPEVAFGEAITLSSADLKAMIALSAYAASTEETRPVLQGVCWEFLEGETRMVATNGHRLAKATLRREDLVAMETVIVLPAALANTDRLLKEGEDVQVARSGNFIGFRLGGAEVYARLRDGTYPDYSRVIPRANTIEMSVDKAEFEEALRRVSSIANRDTHKIVLSLADEAVGIGVETADLGDGSDEVTATVSQGPLKVAFNAQYLLESLRRVPSDRVRMTFAGPEMASMLLQEGGAPDGVTFEGLLMPLRSQAY